MSRRYSSAPGKVVLSGEYAVLDGAPAVSMAVDRRAAVTLDAAGPASVTSLGLGGETDSRLLDIVQNALSLAPWRGAAVLDTREFRDAATGAKLGLGSSAALCVALTAALAPGDTARHALFEVAYRSHREFQRGRGSGVDVATSVFGGVIEYTIDAPPRRLDWPQGLCCQLLWSGKPASTASRLARLDTAPSRASRTSLGEAATRIAKAWAGGDAAQILAEYRDYLQALQRFDIDHRLGIFDAGHDALVRATRSTEIVYKPCGAGGGDVGVVLGLDQGLVRGFAAAARSFRALDMRIDTAGARLQASAT